MKKLIYIPITGLFLLVGCAPMDIDQEYGKASMSSWEMQIVDPAPSAAESTPEGLPGIDAEKVMDVRNKTFGEAETGIGSLTIGGGN